MRTDFSWLENRVSTTWRASPGRSFLFIVPHGCDLEATAAHARNWCQSNVALPAHARNLRPVIIEITVDNVSCSSHFAHQLGRKLEGLMHGVSAFEPERFPADQIAALIENAHSLGGHPVLVIRRFHAFARIADDNLLSVLSTLRTLEHNGQLTTLTVSPMTYHTLRQRLSEQGQFPFVNSAYGDNHEQAVMTPLSRAEFVAAAKRAGLEEKVAQRVFGLGGGPDVVYDALIKAAAEGPARLVSLACRRLSDKLEPFFDSIIDPRLPTRAELRLRLATGQLYPAQATFLQSQECSSFLLAEGPHGRVVAAGPVVSRLLMRGQEGPWVEYEKVVSTLHNGQFAEAARLAALLDRATPHLHAFASLVEILGSLYGGEGEGLFDVGWRRILSIAEELLRDGLPVEAYRPWLEQLIGWSRIVIASVDPNQGGGARLDVLASQAEDADAREAFTFAVSTFLTRVRGAGTPGSRVRTAGNIPESILQALAASLGVNPLAAPTDLPVLDYQRYFGALCTYRLPKPGSKLDLTHLLVIVPAIVAERHHLEKIKLSDPAFVRPLHGKLVARLRNATAHTYAEMGEDEATFFFRVCDSFLGDASEIWKNAAVEERLTVSPPSAEDLCEVLSGRCA